MSRAVQTSKSAAPGWVVWTSELSPFGLKIVLLCRGSGLAVRVLPASGSTRENLGYSRRRERLVRRRLPLTWPSMTPEDEFPSVPYLFGPEGENLYDSTAIAEWLDARADADALHWIPERAPRLEAWLERRTATQPKRCRQPGPSPSTKPSRRCWPRSFARTLS